MPRDDLDPPRGFVNACVIGAGLQLLIVLLVHTL